MFLKWSTLALHHRHLSITGRIDPVEQVRPWFMVVILNAGKVDNGEAGVIG